MIGMFVQQSPLGSRGAVDIYCRAFAGPPDRPVGRLCNHYSTLLPWIQQGTAFPGICQFGAS